MDQTLASVDSSSEAIFSSVPRQATWYNFFITWIIFCTSNLLLLFAGHAYDGEPDIHLCIAQSALTYAASPLCATSALALVVQLYHNIQTALDGNFLLIMPYVIYVIVIIESLGVNLVPYLILATNIDLLRSQVKLCYTQRQVLCTCLLQPGGLRSVFKSSFDSDRVAAALVVILTVPILVLNLLIYLSFRKHWTFLREGKYTSMFVRVSAFTVFGLVSVIVGLFFFLLAFIDPGGANKSLVVLDIIFATVPGAAVIIFGSHKVGRDLLYVWLFWRNGQPSPGARLRELKSLPPLPEGHDNIV
ncbi:hypothetical protein GGU10DRAFT_332341 [Lentinula aff. detonsa]|uniref:Uncharacterized protein n=1 Tax=Lentinula aff. detonsa TaxID=2804958 RepID=A0AA38NMG5_9AGAR|nr:hypothetical protein GGU10DRAFT_332341 [Lentinula aff. detonsa]